jgi:hypothetical protein
MILGEPRIPVCYQIPGVGVRNRLSQTQPTILMVIMKAKRFKAHKRTPVRKKSKSTIRKKTSTTRKTTRHLQKRSIPMPQISTTPTLDAPSFKTCQEPEVGDIGGFGDVDAFESHEKLCGEKATEFCGTCGKNLCSSHYELMHREHSAGGQRLSGQSMSQ